MKPKTPKRFGPEWWACYAAAFAVERRREEDTVLSMRRVERMYSHLGEFDCIRMLRAQTADRAAIIADDAIRGFAEAVQDEGIGGEWAELPDEAASAAER